MTNDPLRGLARPVFLLSDFGSSDHYAGVMRAVIRSIAPGATIDDLTHDVPPQDVRAGAYTLSAAHPFLPDGATVCAVVDPGVGSARRAIAVRVPRADGTSVTYVAPDNGLLTPILAPHANDARAAGEAVSIENDTYVLPQRSATFHGRDVFAPAAAHLALGTPLHALGPRVAPPDLTRIGWPRPERTERGWLARVLHVDRFGNLITNLEGRHLPDDRATLDIHIAGTTFHGVHPTFAAVEPGSFVAYVGSSGRLELAVRNGDASEALGAGVDDELEVTHP